MVAKYNHRVSLQIRMPTCLPKETTKMVPHATQPCQGPKCRKNVIASGEPFCQVCIKYASSCQGPGCLKKGIMNANKDVYCQDCAKNPKVDCEIRGCQRKVILQHDKLPLCAFCSKKEFCKGRGCQRIPASQDVPRPLCRECHQKSVEVAAGNKSCVIAQERINRQRQYRFEQGRWKKAQQQRQYSDRKNEDMLGEHQLHQRPRIVAPPPIIRFQEENIRPHLQHRSQSPVTTTKKAASALARSTAFSRRQQKSTRNSREHGVVIGKMSDDSDDNGEMPEIERLTTNRRGADEEEVERRRRVDWNRSLNNFVEDDTPFGGGKSRAREFHQQQESKKPTVSTKHRLGIALPISALDNSESRASQSPIRGVRANNANVDLRTPVLGRKLPTAFVRRVQEKSRKSGHTSLARVINHNQQDSSIGDDDGFALGFEDDFMDSAATPTLAAVTIANRVTLEDEDRGLLDLKLNGDYGGPKTRLAVGDDDSEDSDTEANHGNARRKRRGRASKRYRESKFIDELEDSYHSRLEGSYWAKDKHKQSLRHNRNCGIDSDGDQPRRSQRDRRAKPPPKLPPPKLTRKQVSKKQLHDVKKRQRVKEPETPKWEGSAVSEVGPALKKALDLSKSEKVSGKKEVEVQLEEMGYYVPKNVMERVLAHPEDDENNPRMGYQVVQRPLSFSTFASFVDKYECQSQNSSDVKAEAREKVRAEDMGVEEKMGMWQESNKSLDIRVDVLRRTIRAELPGISDAELETLLAMRLDEGTVRMLHRDYVCLTDAEEMYSGILKDVYSKRLRGHELDWRDRAAIKLAEKDSEYAEEQTKLAESAIAKERKKFAAFQAAHQTDIPRGMKMAVVVPLHVPFAPSDTNSGTSDDEMEIPAWMEENEMLWMWVAKKVANKQEKAVRRGQVISPERAGLLPGQIQGDATLGGEGNNYEDAGLSTKSRMKTRITERSDPIFQRSDDGKLREEQDDIAVVTYASAMHRTQSMITQPATIAPRQLLANSPQDWADRRMASFTDNFGNGGDASQEIGFDNAVLTDPEAGGLELADFEFAEPNANNRMSPIVDMAQFIDDSEDNEDNEDDEDDGEERRSRCQFVGPTLAAKKVMLDEDKNIMAGHSASQAAEERIKELMAELENLEREGGVGRRCRDMILR